jgi:hypothetical protein
MLIMAARIWPFRRLVDRSLRFGISANQLRANIEAE